MARYDLPTVDELLELGTPRANAVTVYTPAIAADYEVAHTTVKSALDEAIRTFREQGASHALQAAFKQRATEILADDAWSALSRSVAVFTTDEKSEIFVLPNKLEAQTQVGDYFDLGQLVRAVAVPQEAYALTLSADGWNLWLATADAVVHELDIDSEGNSDVAEATNRATVRGRGQLRRLQGDEGTKVLLETYAKRVFETISPVLHDQDPGHRRPLFVFAADPLIDMYRTHEHGPRELVSIHGSPDALRADQIDAAIREHLADINARRAAATVETLADGMSAGLVATDLVDIARAAVTGAVDTLVYDFTVDVLGDLNGETGEVTYRDDGYDLLSRIAIRVLRNGGTVVPVRSADITSDIWNGTAVARLRYPLAK